MFKLWKQSVGFSFKTTVTEYSLNTLLGIFQVLQCGGTESPTKPKGRPKKDSFTANSDQDMKDTGSEDQSFVVVDDENSLDCTELTDCEAKCGTEN